MTIAEFRPQTGVVSLASYSASAATWPRGETGTAESLGEEVLKKQLLRDMWKTTNDAFAFRIK